MSIREVVGQAIYERQQMHRRTTGKLTEKDKERIRKEEYLRAQTALNKQKKQCRSA